MMEPSTRHGYELENPINIAFKYLKGILVCFILESSFAQEGKTVFEVFFESNYEFWKKFKKNREDYLNEKKKISSHVINGLSQIQPNN